MAIAQPALTGRLAGSHLAYGRHGSSNGLMLVLRTGRSSYGGTGEKHSHGPASDVQAHHHNVYLNKKLSGARRAEEVFQLCEAHAHEFNFVNVVTAIHRLAKAPDGRPELGYRLVASLRSQLRASTMTASTEIAPLSLANTVWACAKLRVWDGPLLSHVS